MRRPGSKLAVVALGSAVSIFSSCTIHPNEHWAQPDRGDGWSTLGGDATGGFYSPHTLSEHPQIQWERRIDTQGTSAIAVSPYDLMSFTTTNPTDRSCTLYTLMVNSGRRDFCWPIQRNNYANHPLVDRYGNIYTGIDGVLLAYDWFGPIRWRTLVEGTPIVSQFLSPNALITVTDKGHVYLVDAHLGTIIGDYDVKFSPGESLTSPIIIDPHSGGIFFATNKRAVSLAASVHFPYRDRIDIESDPTPVTDTPEASYHPYAYAGTMRPSWQYYVNKTSQASRRDDSPSITGMIYDSHSNSIVLITTTSLVVLDSFGNVRISQRTPETIRYATAIPSRGLYLASDTSLYEVSDPQLNLNKILTFPDRLISHPTAMGQNEILYVTQSASTIVLRRFILGKGNTAQPITVRTNLPATLPQQQAHIAISKNGTLLLTVTARENPTTEGTTILGVH